MAVAAKWGIALPSACISGSPFRGSGSPMEQHIKESSMRTARLEESFPDAAPLPVNVFPIQGKDRSFIMVTLRQAWDFLASFGKHRTG